MQSTLARAVTFEGTGLHLGRPARMTVRPAAANKGIRFRRVDLPGSTPVPALWNRVERSPLMTRLSNGEGTEVSTVEHVMAALWGCGIHNATVELDGPEPPILDGSSAGFVRPLLDAGVVTLDAPLSAIEILEPVEVASGDARARLEPCDRLRIDFEIDFDEYAIGHQSLSLDMANGTFVRELCDSRTFCRQRDVEAMQANGLALGGTLRNAVVVEGANVLSPGGLRHPDEAVRHKMLDCMGDLALAGAPILGRYVGVRSGHAVTNQLLRSLFARPGAWRRVPVDERLAARLPGSGMRAADLAAVA